MKNSELKLAKKLIELNLIQSYSPVLIDFTDFISNQTDIDRITWCIKNINGFNATMLDNVYLYDLYELENYNYALFKKNSFISYSKNELERYDKLGLLLPCFYRRDLLEIARIRTKTNDEIRTKNEKYLTSIKKEKLSKIIVSETIKSHDGCFYRLIEKYAKYTNVSKGNYFSIREGKISYHTKPNEQIVIKGLGTWSKKGRQVTSIAKALKLIFGRYYDLIIRIENINIEQESLKLNVVKLSAIKTTFEKAYSIDMTGWSQTSCMKGKGYLQLYTDNPTIFTPYLFKENGLIVGRAYTVNCNDTILLDRIYFKNEKHLESIKKLAFKKGWLNKLYNSYDCNIFVDSKGKYFYPTSIDAVIDINSELPFVDTWCYSDGNVLSVNENNMDYKFQNTDGEYCSIDDDGHEGQTQVENGDWYDDEYVIRVEIGRSEGEYHHTDDCRFVERGSNAGWAHENDCEYNNNLGEYILNN